MASTPTIRMRGVYLRDIHVKIPAAGDKSVTAHMTADWTDVVAEQMGWGEHIPIMSEKNPEEQVGTKFVPLALEGAASAKLRGSLVAQSMIMTHKGTETEIDLDISWVGDFEVHATKDKEGNSTGRELRFQIESGSKTAGAKLEAYANKIGREKAAAKIMYEKQQSLLQPDDPQNNLEGVEGGEAPEDNGTGSLASAREMGAGRRKKLSEVN